MLLTDLIGTAVRDESGTRLGRVADIAVRLGAGRPQVTSLQVRAAGKAGVDMPWETVTRLDKSGANVRAPGTRALGRDEILLAADVLDRQIFDSRGKRVTRVGDVELLADGAALRVAGVETGAATILRRLGLRRLARRFRAHTLDWDDLHLLSGRGHALQLDADPDQALRARAGLADRRSRRRRTHALAARRRAPS